MSFFDIWWKKSVLYKIIRLQNKVLKLKNKTSQLEDQELKEKFNYFRKIVKNSKDIDKYLVPVYALVREVIQRQTGLLLFPSQVFGGIVLHYGNIAQMNTGEGKTLTALLPACLNTLAPELVIMTTVNEYLVKRD